MIIRFHELAQAELRFAADDYEAKHHLLGQEFIATVARSLDRISTFPDSGGPYIAETRRLVLGRFPFSIVYSREDDSLVVLAVAHHRRLPGYWKDRR